jgi:LVIVD repeat
MPRTRWTVVTLRHLSLAAGLAYLAACASSSSSTSGVQHMPLPAPTPAPTTAPRVDPRVGLKAGVFDAGQAAWNMRLLSNTPPADSFGGFTNSDLAFYGHYAVQGNYNGFEIWDISDPTKPVLAEGYVCPASQNDVSVYKNLLFMSAEGFSGRLDCGTQGVHDSVSADRMRGVRIFDISDLTHPKNVANVQTCRGSHTHTLVEDPNDTENVYIYVSGSAPVRSPTELPGCVAASPDSNPNSALFRIEVIKVPVAHPEQAAIVTSPRIFNDLTAPPVHAEAPEDIAAAKARAAAWRAKGGYTAMVHGTEFVLPPQFINPMLDSIAKTRGDSMPNAADSATLRGGIQAIVDKMVGAPAPGAENGPRPGPNQCHDITVYPAIGFAGGACAGYGFLLDIHDVAHPVRVAAVSDSNFSYWHSATFSNDGRMLLFSDEWGGGGGPKCRATDRPEWGADAIFTIDNGALKFQSYYKMLAPQTEYENCVAHNGSLIPIPGRTVMVQAWYQGGVSVFDWTDPAHPKEIAFFDRGPMDSTKLVGAGSWSAYWYNGVIVSSEIARGLDIFQLTPSPYLTQNEIDAAQTVHLDRFNTQDQPKLVWPTTFALARAYLDQLARSNGLSAARVTAVRAELTRAEGLSGMARHNALAQLGTQLNGDAAGSSDQAKARLLASTVTDLAGAQ